MDTGRPEQLERALRQLGLHNTEDLAQAWASHGFGPQEMVAWLNAGVMVDEPHLAAALAAAEWSPTLAGRTVATGDQLTFVQVIRHHPNSAIYARELRRIAGA